jgi:hypothetical protein
MRSIPASTLTQAEHEDVTAELYRFGNELEAVKLHELRSLREASPSEASVVTFLATAPRNLTRTQAGQDVELAKLTDPSAEWDGVIGGLAGDRGALQITGQKLASGDASRAHLDVARRALKKIPTHVRRGTLDTVAELDDGTTVHGSHVKARVLDAIFATTVVQYAPGTTDQLVSDVLTMLHHDAAGKLDTDPDGTSRRSLTIERHHGMTRYVIDADDVSDPVIRQALNAVSAPAPATCRDNGSTVERDPRTLEQRRFDGFMDLITRGVDAGDAAVRDTATVLVHVPVDRLTGEPAADPATVDGGHSISDTVLRYLACDARLRAVVHDADGLPLAITSSQRTATGQQRALLAMRDRGCVAPGCNAPAWLCQAHHVTFWSDGGPTDTTNMVLVCPNHHRQVHSGLLEVRFAADGRPEARWTRPTGRLGPRPIGPWTRNDYPKHLKQVKIAARLLMADTDVGSNPRAA